MGWVRRFVRQKVEFYIYSFDAFKKQQMASPIRVYPKIVHWLTGRGLSLRLHVSISLGKEWLRHFGDACLIKSTKIRTFFYQRYWYIPHYNIVRTSCSGCRRFADSTLSVSSLEIFLVAGFSRTIFKLDLLEDWVTHGVVKADAEAIPDATARGRNFMMMKGFCCCIGGRH
jgi:hypothetical protein